MEERVDVGKQIFFVKVERNLLLRRRHFLMMTHNKIKIANENQIDEQKTTDDLSYKDLFFLKNYNDIYKKYFSNKREKILDQQADLDDLDN